MDFVENIILLVQSDIQYLFYLGNNKCMCNSVLCGWCLELFGHWLLETTWLGILNMASSYALGGSFNGMVVFWVVPFQVGFERGRL